jgi:molybdopterin molybdotransferase
MDTVESARAHMQSAVQALGSESVQLRAAADRTLAETLAATRDQPPFRSSAMDGYAVRSADLDGGRLTIVGQSAAGAAYEGTVARGQAVRIFTGAPVPPGADSVIPQEFTQRDGNKLAVDASARPTRNIRRAAIDFGAGDHLIGAGTRLNARHIALLAAAGIASVNVRRVPRIALLATGTEIAAPGTPAGPYQIYDSVTFGLAAMIETWGGQPLHAAPSPDHDEAVSAAIGAALEVADLAVIVGGASVGDFDIVKRALGQRGLTILVPNVAVRPGKPTWFGTLDGKAILGLPGNPAAAFVCAYLFLRPLLHAFLARSAASRLMPAVLDGTLGEGGDKESYWRARVRVGEDARLTVRPFDNQDTSLVSVFASSNALIRSAAGAGPAAPGTIVEVMLLDGPGGDFAGDTPI